MGIFVCFSQILVLPGSDIATDVAATVSWD
jgi:hypothetical protein